MSLRIDFQADEQSGTHVHINTRLLLCNECLVNISFKNCAHHFI